MHLPGAVVGAVRRIVRLGGFIVMFGCFLVIIAGHVEILQLTRTYRRGL